MNPEVKRFIEDFDKKHQGAQRQVTLGEIEILFLEQVFGPEFSYNFKGLTAQFPFKDYKGGNRYADFHYAEAYVKFIVEIDGHKFHVSDITPAQYDEHQERQNDMILTGGWILLRFTANMIMRKPMLCRRQLMHAVGRSYTDSLARARITSDDLWTSRKNELLKFAGMTDMITQSQVAKRYGVHPRTAGRWLQNMINEELLSPIKPNQKIVGYAIKTG